VRREGLRWPNKLKRETGVREVVLSDSEVDMEGEEPQSPPAKEEEEDEEGLSEEPEPEPQPHFLSSVDFSFPVFKMSIMDVLFSSGLVLHLCLLKISWLVSVSPPLVSMATSKQSRNT